MKQKNMRYTGLKTAVFVLLLFVMIMFVSSVQKKQIQSSSKENVYSDMQTGPLQTARNGISTEETESLKEYVTSVFLLLVMFLQCTGQKVYLARSELLENPKVVQIIRFIKQLDGKKEQTSYYA